MSAGYVVARENFKEAAKHVSAETDPVMFNLLYGLQSLTNQIESDFAALWTRLQDQKTSKNPNKKRIVVAKKSRKKSGKKRARK
ncbi:hypothetical protein [Bradyrhizobium sp. JYMT SZCCT0428]|uniref:hypothetical protein n=1 Tax=Bradyrhizobium sp. JYMT SZCCT0428 TaxID=2807673 RepID=UPI001BA60459|nr:hypothetical protein [Bradyrhizobium sp. JYMT SZCCT0428]MBR1155222.1 hypothetical protein [Bradyrhizobium sp. JYMT SZCCT0428]